MNFKIGKSEYSRNILTLLTGTTLSQAIPIAISPILTRIYSPADFGLFTLFIALTSILSSISSGRYELAILLPEKDENAINILALCVLLISSLSIISLFIIILFNDSIIGLLKNDQLEYWLYLLPISIFFAGLFNILTYYNIRIKNYKDISKSKVIKSVASAFIQLSVGFIKSGVTGLISGHIFSQLFSNLKLIKNITKNERLISEISLEKIKLESKRYKNFPKFSLPATLLNTMSGSFINILISSFYSVATLGFYSLVLRLVSMPTTLIGGSISSVFFQEATKEKIKTGKSEIIFKKSFLKLFQIGIPVFTILFFIAEDLFAFVFGEDWRIAGQYAQIVIPFFFIRFISAALSIVLSVYEKQKVELIFNSIILATSLSLFTTSPDFITFLYRYSILMSINYSVFLLYYFRLSTLKS